MQKSGSAKGRSVDLNMDAGKCQLSSSEQHPGIWQLEGKIGLLFSVKSNVSGSGCSHRAALRMGWFMH